MSKLRSSILLAIGSLALALTFQNCAPSPNEEATTLPSEVVLCPLIVYTEPLCEADEEITIAVDDCGDRPVCTKKSAGNTCPLHMEPLCNSGEVIVITFDVNKCPMPKCVSKKSAILCPIYNRPLCEVGDALVSITDMNGCPKPMCAAK